jgi:hypothetical protein
MRMEIVFVIHYVIHLVSINVNSDVPTTEVILDRSLYTLYKLPSHQISSPCRPLSIEIHYALATTDHIHTRTNRTTSHAGDLVNVNLLL